MGKLFDKYRPELHYMRGPGPKWHEKYGGVSPEAGNKLELPSSLWLIPAAAVALLGVAAAVALA